MMRRFSRFVLTKVRRVKTGAQLVYFILNHGLHTMACSLVWCRRHCLSIRFIISHLRFISLSFDSSFTLLTLGTSMPVPWSLGRMWIL